MGEKGIELGNKKGCLESGILEIERILIEENWIGGKEFKCLGYLGLSG